MAERELIERLDQAIDSLLAGSFAGAEDQELSGLVEVAQVLCDLPSENFRDKLRTELQRRTTMTGTTATPAATTAKFKTITPFLIHANAPGLVDFIKTVFNAGELKRKDGAEFYSELQIGDTVIMVGGGEAASHGNLSAALHVYVDDCDAAYHRAIDAGAKTLMGAVGEPANRPYGERAAFVEDAYGNYWYIATRLPSNRAPEGVGSLLAHVHPKGARNYIDFLKRAFGAEEMEVVEHGGKVVHGAVRIGDAVLEMGEPDDPTGIPLNGFFLFVDDVEGTYQRALAAGAQSVRPPAEIPYGLKSGIVRDPAGYFWWPAKWLR